MIKLQLMHKLLMIKASAARQTANDKSQAENEKNSEI
jgi:hypothetical protein